MSSSVNNDKQSSSTTEHYSLADFEKRTYNGFEITVHKQTLYVNATKLCHDVSLKEGKHIKEFKNIKVSPQFKDYCDYLYEELTDQGSADIQPTKRDDKSSSIYRVPGQPVPSLVNYLINPEFHDLIEVVSGRGYSNDVRGTYVHPDLVHYVLTLTSVKYLRITTQIMNTFDKKIHEQLVELKLLDKPEHAEPLFQKVVCDWMDSANMRGQAAFEAQYCWGYRD